MILMAEAMSFEDLVKGLQDAITEYNINPSEENVSSIQFGCMMILSKQAAERSNGAMNLIKESEEYEMAAKLFKPSKQ